MASNVTTRAGNRVGNRAGNVSHHGTPRHNLQSPAPISVGSRVIEIPDSPTDENGPVPRRSTLPPPPYTSTPPPAASASRPSFAATERIDPSILLAFEILDLDETSRLLVLRCVSCTPGFPQCEWEGILEHGGLSSNQIEILLPLMNDDYYDDL